MAEVKSDIQGSLVPVTKQQAMVMLESGYLWMDLGNHDAARELFAGAAVLMPKSDVPQTALGTLEINVGAYDKALQAFRAAQRLAPKSALARAHAGEALLFMGKLGEAKKELTQAIELGEGPDRDFAQQTLDNRVSMVVAAAYAAANRGDLKKARELVSVAAKEDGTDAGVALAQGDFDAAEGKRDAAKAAYLRASELSPKDSVPKARLAALALIAQEKGEALKLAQEAKKLATAQHVSDEALAAIDDLIKQAK
jgi:tetratricopeptide (TPR) repeat protein